MKPCDKICVLQKCVTQICYQMCQQNVLHEIAIIFDIFKDKNVRDILYVKYNMCVI